MANGIFRSRQSRALLSFLPTICKHFTSNLPFAVRYSERSVIKKRPLLKRRCCRSVNRQR